MARTAWPSWQVMARVQFKLKHYNSMCVFVVFLVYKKTHFMKENRWEDESGEQNTADRERHRMKSAYLMRKWSHPPDIEDRLGGRVDARLCKCVCFWCAWTYLIQREEMVKSSNISSQAWALHACRCSAPTEPPPQPPSSSATQWCVIRQFSPVSLPHHYAGCTLSTASAFSQLL